MLWYYVPVQATCSQKTSNCPYIYLTYKQYILQHNGLYPLPRHTDTADSLTLPSFFAPANNRLAACYFGTCQEQRSSVVCMSQKQPKERELATQKGVRGNGGEGPEKGLGQPNQVAFLRGPHIFLPSPYRHITDCWCSDGDSYSDLSIWNLTGVVISLTKPILQHAKLEWCGYAFYDDFVKCTVCLIRSHLPASFNSHCYLSRVLQCIKCFTNLSNLISETGCNLECITFIRLKICFTLNGFFSCYQNHFVISRACQGKSGVHLHNLACRLYYYITVTISILTPAGTL